MSIQLPEAFITKMKNLLKEETAMFLKTYQDERTAGLRLNPLKITNEKWESISPFPIEKSPLPITDIIIITNKMNPENIRTIEPDFIIFKNLVPCL